MEGHRSCAWREWGLGPGGSRKNTAKTHDFLWKATSRADVGGNLAETIDVFALHISQQQPPKHFRCSEGIISLDLSSRTIRRHLKNMEKFSTLWITERQGEWNPLKWTRLANNLEWTGVWIVQLYRSREHLQLKLHVYFRLAKTFRLFCSFWWVLMVSMKFISKDRRPTGRHFFSSVSSPLTRKIPTIAARK